MRRKLLILGGYGNAGFLIARLLLQESDLGLIIAGRNIDRAQQAAKDLNREFHTDRMSSRQIDATDPQSLRNAFVGVDIVVSASSTLDHVGDVARSALEAGADHLDIHLSSPRKMAVLNALRQKIESGGRCFITDGGFHPGVPAAMIRYAALKFDALEVADISAVFKINWKKLTLSDSTISEFAGELMNFNPLVMTNKEWIKTGITQSREFDFGEPFGKQKCLPMFLEELRSLPDVNPSLHQAGFHVAGFNWMTDYVIMPAAFAAFSLLGDRVKKPVATLFGWGLKQFSKPPFGCVLELEAGGMKDGRYNVMRMRLSHDDAYVLTAVPVVACLLQYLNGRIRRSGLWLQANVVEPVRFFHDVERLGVTVAIDRNGGQTSPLPQTEVER